MQLWKKLKKFWISTLSKSVWVWDLMKGLIFWILSGHIDKRRKGSAISNNSDTLAICGAVTGTPIHFCIWEPKLFKKMLKRSHLRSRAKDSGVQPVRGRQVRRYEWWIMILLEISQHAVVGVGFPWCLINRQAVWVVALKMPQRKINIFILCFAAFLLRGVVSNRSITFIEVKDYGSKTKSQKLCGRGWKILLPHSCVF